MDVKHLFWGAVILISVILLVVFGINVEVTHTHYLPQLEIVDAGKGLIDTIKGLF